MAETLTELVAKIETDAAGLKSGLSDAEKQTEASSKKMSDSLKQVGVAMAASGTVITAALGLMGKAAIDEEINIKRLSTTMENAGTSYDSVKDSLEAVIAATQRKTGIADDEQRDILGRLILITQDYDKALSLLPTVLDLAAVGQMDATTAATYLSKAYLDLEDGAEKVSVRFGQASLQFESMEDIQNRVRGAAENLANPLSVLKASVGDVAEAIGSFLVPTIEDAVDKIVDIAIKIQEWTNEHPVLADVIIKTTLALGALLLLMGSIILIVPKVIGVFVAFKVVLLTTIPMIWAHVTALWAQVTATLAAMAATGVLIPAVIAAVVAITALTIGINELVKRQKEQANMTNEASQSLQTIADTADDYSDKLDKASKSTKKLKEETEKLSDSLRETVGNAFMYYSSLSGKRDLTPFEIEQRKAFGGILGIPGYQTGGIVPGSLGEPQLAMVHGGETIIPANESMGVTVNISGPLFMEREDDMNKFVDKISRTLDRKYRLSGRSLA